VSNDSDHSTESSVLTPNQRLEPSNVDLLNAGIITISDIETVRACVSYENANQRRVPVLRKLSAKAEQIRSEGQGAAQRSTGDGPYLEDVKDSVVTGLQFGTYTVCRFQRCSWHVGNCFAGFDDGRSSIVLSIVDPHSIDWPSAVHKPTGSPSIVGRSPVLSNTTSIVAGSSMGSRAVHHARPLYPFRR